MLFTRVCDVPVPRGWRSGPRNVSVRGHELRRVAFYFLRFRKMPLHDLDLGKQKHRKQKTDNSVELHTHAPPDTHTHPRLGSP